MSVIWVSKGAVWFIFVTHHLSFKIPKFSKLHSFDTLFSLHITQIFQLFVGSIPKHLVKVRWERRKKKWIEMRKAKRKKKKKRTGMRKAKRKKKKERNNKLKKKKEKWKKEKKRGEWSQKLRLMSPSLCVYLQKCHHNSVSIPWKHLKCVFNFHNSSLKN